MTTQTNEVDRRDFLKALAMTAAAATVVGGGAGYLANKADQAPLVTSLAEVPAPPVVSAAETMVTANDEIAELLAKLASARAENMKMKAELDAAQRRLAALEEANGDAGQVNETLQTELAAATEEVSLLAGLVALYEELEEGDLWSSVEEGIASFGLVLGDLRDEIPTLEEGVTAGAQALDAFEAQIPLVKEGRNWLESQLARLDTFYRTAEDLLAAAVEGAGSFLQKIEEWFQGIRKWLPFGVGDRAAEVMAALSMLLDETPRTMHGLRRNVAEPLDTWLQSEEDETALHAHLVKPLKEKTLNRAGSVVEQARQAGEAYDEHVVSAVSEAAQNRRALKEKISAYRKQHQI